MIRGNHRCLVEMCHQVVRQFIMASLNNAQIAHSRHLLYCTSLADSLAMQRPMRTTRQSSGIVRYIKIVVRYFIYWATLYCELRDATCVIAEAAIFALRRALR